MPWRTRSHQFSNTPHGNQLLALTWQQGLVGELVHLQDEVILEEEVAHDGEEVDQDESQHGGQDDGAPVARDALDDVEQRLLPVHQVKELGTTTPPHGAPWCHPVLGQALGDSRS